MIEVSGQGSFGLHGTVLWALVYVVDVVFMSCVSDFTEWLPLLMFISVA